MNRYYTSLVHTLFLKSLYITLSLNYSLILACALGSLGRRFESCRPDHLNPSYTSEFPRLAFLLDKSVHKLNGQIMDKLAVNFQRILKKSKGEEYYKDQELSNIF